MNNLTLSEAIRLGAMLKPQGFDVFGDKGSCALTAAADAAGIPLNTCPITRRPWTPFCRLSDRFPLLETPALCPKSGYEGPLFRVIYRLNDLHHWTREQIADWVAALEAQQEPQPVLVEVCHDAVAV